MSAATRSDISRQVQQALLNLGNNRIEVAQFLLNAGHHGRPLSQQRNPIRFYLQAKGFQVEIVTHSLVIVNQGSERVQVIVPDPVFNFLEKFDAGDVKELIR